jgi:hypothetical protein
VKGLHFRPPAALVAAAIGIGSLGTALGLPIAGAARPALAAEPPHSTYVALDPVRILDTRVGTGRGGVIGPVPGGGSIDLMVTNVGGVPATGVDAVALNVTATNGTAVNSYLTVFPAGGPRPLASNLNFTGGTTVPNLVFARVGANGKVTVYNNAGTTDVVADVQGWYASSSNPGVGAQYSPLEPSRLLDTRIGVGVRPGPVHGGETIDLPVTGRGAVPVSGVSAVVLNVTATAASGPDTFVTVFPTGTARPLASNLNVVRGQTAPNLVVVRVRDGKVSLYNNAGTVDLVADVQGWYAPTGALATGLSTYVPVAPVRALDTRDGTGTGGVAGRMGAGGLVHLQLGGTNGIPASGVTAVVLNVAAVDHIGPDSYLTVYPALSPRPLASNLNYTFNQTVANLVVARVNANGTAAFYNNLGAVHLVADIQGWFVQTG